MDFFKKSPFVFMSDFQSVSFLLLRVSGRKIGQMNLLKHCLTTTKPFYLYAFFLLLNLSQARKFIPYPLVGKEETV